jgi:hypothetical protein
VSFQSHQDGSHRDLSKNLPENQACRSSQDGDNGAAKVLPILFLAQPLEELAFSLIE